MTKSKLTFLHDGDLYDVFVEDGAVVWIHIYSSPHFRRPEARTWSELDQSLKDRITEKLHNDLRDLSKTDSSL